MPAASIWISYDLGIKGDYEGLYTWLDGHGAIECVDSLAYIKFAFKTSVVDELKDEMSKSVTIDKRTRIYVIYRDRVSNKQKGTFIFGGRRAGAWAGYATDKTAVVDEDA
jgi:hypothetical protein